jgi:hypothetical protein
MPAAPDKLRPGDRVGTQFFNGVLDALIGRIVGLHGICVRRIGNKLGIECTLKVPSMRGGVGGVDEVTAEDKAALEALSLPDGTFARTTGDDKRAYRVLGGELICYSHLE